jgi:hypothetical protein
MPKTNKMAKALKVDAMSSLSLPALAQILEREGRNGDMMLAHITPQEAVLLAQNGGSATINPKTGLPEFFLSYEDFGADSYMKGASYEAPSYQAAPDFTPTRGLSSESDFYTGGGYEPPDYTPSYTEGRPYVPPKSTDFTARDYLPEASITGDQGFNFDAFMKGGAPGVQPLYEGADAEMRRGIEPGVETAPGKEQVSGDYVRRAIEQIKNVTGLEEDTLKKLGLAGILGLSGMITSRKARQEGQVAKKEQQDLAAPYRARGAELTGAAQRGELTPQGQQSLQIAQARLAQDAASRGGVGAQQAATQIENLRQQMLAQQYDLGLKVSSIADNIALGAIRTGMQADQMINQANQDFFTQMAQILGGQPSATGTSPTVVIRR